MGHLHEECGVFGVYSREADDLAMMTYYALYALQHRGQESAGIVVNDDGVFTYAKGEGLVSEVFHPKNLRSLGKGNIAVGHVRYATTGAKLQQNIQPLIVNHHKGRMALCHNGNLSNSYELRTELEENGAIFHTTTDSEVISYIIVRERLKQDSIEKAVSAAMDVIEGAYSLVISSPQKLIAARDPHGFRPLCYGETDDGKIVFASESCALDAVGAKLVRDLLPGEIAVADSSGIRFDTSKCGKKEKRFCVFEYIYFARPDSVIDGASVSRCRRNAGRFLAMQHPVKADIVIGVPDSGLEAAIGYSQESGIPYAIGFTKNKYIARTFISPDMEQRSQGVGIKLNPIRDVIAGKRVVLIDDSIVRGTTCRHIVGLLWQAGAKEIHFRVSAPPFIGPCYYGTDIDNPDVLIANRMSIGEIAREIGVTTLGYLSIENVRLLSGEDTGFCTACFGGGYPTAVPSDTAKNRFETRISEKKQV
ncbi:MAG: amidophosphoribosyltransferase [Clostridia bacterium]|nr:amidophosphoribosyltransferase [Clostridia bacterium]